MQPRRPRTPPNSAPGRPDQIPADGEPGPVLQAEVPPVEVRRPVQVHQHPPAADEKPGVPRQQLRELPEGQPGGQHPAPGGVNPHLVLEVLGPEDVPQAHPDGLPPGTQLHVLLRGGEDPLQQVEKPLQLLQPVGLHQIPRGSHFIALNGKFVRGGAENQAAVLVHSPNAPGGLHAVHARKEHIQKNNVPLSCGKRL